VQPFRILQPIKLMIYRSFQRCVRICESQDLLLVKNLGCAGNVHDILASGAILDLSGFGLDRFLLYVLRQFCCVYYETLNTLQSIINAFNTED
jgi:hypothetical protein